MSVIDDETRFREELAECLRERDRQREPRERFRRPRRELAGRDAFRVGLAERAAGSVGPRAAGDPRQCLPGLGDPDAAMAVQHASFSEVRR